MIRSGDSAPGPAFHHTPEKAISYVPGDTTDEQSIVAAAPNADLLLVNKEGNTDGRFTAVAQAKKNHLIEVEKNLDLLAEIQKLYGK